MATMSVTLAPAYLTVLKCSAAAEAMPSRVAIALRWGRRWIALPLVGVLTAESLSI